MDVAEILASNADKALLADLSVLLDANQLHLELRRKQKPLAAGDDFGRPRTVNYCAAVESWGGKLREFPTSILYRELSRVHR